MDYVERKTEEFLSHHLDRHDSDDELKSNLNQYLYLFNRNADKRRFLGNIHAHVKQKYDEHLPVCKRPDTCGTNRHYEAALFFIGQELEDLLGYSDSEKFNEDEEAFSFDERLKLDQRLDEVLARLEKLGLGQEIIFNEIDELRNQTDLNKKNWKQLLKGKLIDLSISKLVENDTVNWIYKLLTDDNVKLLS